MRRLAHLAGTVDRAFDPGRRWFGGRGHSGGLLELRLQHGLLALTAEVPGVKGVQMLPGEVVGAPTRPQQPDLVVYGPLPEGAGRSDELGALHHEGSFISR